MKLRYLSSWFFLIAMMFTGPLSYAQSKKILEVDYSQPKGDIQPTMWGVFFEDINLGADGGIYAELVKNRSFEFHRPMMGWTVRQKKFVEGRVLVTSGKEVNTANPRFIRVTVDNQSKGRYYNLMLLYRTC